jgi:class 3 adenylate cyclase
MNLPSGTLTFLFTDIEGSTRLWEEQPDTMRLALSRHDALLRAAIETNGGTVFKTIGDAFCAAFPTAPQAIEAALTAQQSLQNVRAGVGGELTLKVRMALHTGAAEQRDGDYFGPPLNRAARLLSIGHGGQVLLSSVTQELVCESLPASVTLRNQGEHRLRDLSRPETVFQLLHPDLPWEFPPLKSLDNPAFPNNLPRQVTSFIGREKEWREIQERIKTSSLLTLTGSGGCGKTRLSLQVAAEVLEVYPDGVWFVEFAPLADPAL